MIQRNYEPLDQYIKPNKVLVIYGPRQVGKTTLLQNYLSQTNFKYLSSIGDDLPTQQLFGSLDASRILEFIEGYDMLAIDEAQYIPNIGKALKIIVDHTPGFRVIATGSSSFELAGQIGEPLTGRKHTLTLYPISQSELLSLHNTYELRQKLDEYLIYGTYPEVIMASTNREKIDIIMEIAGSYLLKDLLAFDSIRSAGKLWDLLKLLAFQVGSLVSHNELSNNLGVDVKTIQRYLDLLEKAFVIIRTRGFSRNLRKEVTKKAKYYFYDNGLRNAIITQFNPIADRNDIGQLWENFMIIERIKYLSYSSIYANLYFWRTYDKQEIDLVEERDGNLFAFEFKWSPIKRISEPILWRTTYPNSEFKLISSDNYQEIVLPQPR